MNKKIVVFLEALTFFLLVFSFVFASPAQAATFNIPDGDVFDLIEKMNEAKTNGEANTINLSPGGNYVLTQAVPPDYIYGPNGLPVVVNDLTINGNGATIERQSSDYFRIMIIAGTGILRINDVTLGGGELRPSGAGGGIVVDGTLIMRGVTMRNNYAGSFGGGDIWRRHRSSFERQSRRGLR